MTLDPCPLCSGRPDAPQADTDKRSVCPTCQRVVFIPAQISATACDRDSRAMAASQVAAIFGAALISIGVFAPVLNMPIVGSMSFSQNALWCLVFIGFSVSVVILSVSGNSRRLWLLGVLALCFISVKFVDLTILVRDIGDDASNRKGDDILGLAQLTSDATHVGWGWGPLIVGPLLIILAAWLDSRNNGRGRNR